MTVDGSCEEYLRLPFTVSPEIVEAGIARLATAWRQYEDMRLHRSESLRVVV
jgi:hypothetical protein